MPQKRCHVIEINRTWRVWRGSEHGSNRSRHFSGNTRVVLWEGESDVRMQLGKTEWKVSIHLLSRRTDCLCSRLSFQRCMHNPPALKHRDMSLWSKRQGCFLSCQMDLCFLSAKFLSWHKLLPVQVLPDPGRLLLMLPTVAWGTKSWGSHLLSASVTLCQANLLAYKWGKTPDRDHWNIFIK